MMALKRLACLPMVGLLAACVTTGGANDRPSASFPSSAPSGASPSALSAASASRAATSRNPSVVRGRLIRFMMMRAGVMAVCGQRRYANRAIWNAMITNRLPPATGQWSLPQLRAALQRSIRASVALRRTGRLQCGSSVVLKMARDTNSIYALLRRRFPRVPSAEAIASRRGVARGAQNTRQRRISDLFDAPSRGIQGF